MVRPEGAQHVVPNRLSRVRREHPPPQIDGLPGGHPGPHLFGGTLGGHARLPGEQIDRRAAPPGGRKRRLKLALHPRALFGRHRLRRRAAPAAEGGVGRDDLAASNRRHGRVAPEHERIAAGHDGGALQPQLRDRRLAGAEARPIEQPDAPDDLAGANVQPDSRVVGQRGGGLQQADADVEQGGRLNTARGDKPVAADDLVFGRADDVEGNALARLRRVDRHPMALHLPDPHLLRGRQQFEHLSRANPARPERSGDNRAEPGHRETPINGQAGRSVDRAGRRIPQRGVDGGDKGRDPVAPAGGDGEDRRAIQEGPRGRRPDIVRDERKPVLIGDQIDLVQDDDPPAQLEEPEDVQVLAGLRHHAFVRGDHQQHQVDPGGAGEHVSDEALVTGHVHEAAPPAARQIEVREAEVEGHPPSFLLLEPVRVDPRERSDEGALPVIDVAGGADDGIPEHGRGGGAGRA